MLPIKNRLKLSHNEKNRFSGAERVSSTQFRLIAKKQPDGFRAAITVSKKVAPRAVDRNRIKRLVSEALHSQAVFGGELLVIVNKNIADLKKNEVQKRLFALLSKLK